MAVVLSRLPISSSVLKMTTGSAGGSRPSSSTARRANKVWTIEAFISKTPGPWATPFSTSQGRGVFMDQALELLPSDCWRWWLLSNAPESNDTDFTWAEFLRRNNDELVAGWGNLVNRVLNMTQRYFDGQVPDPGPLTAADEALLAAVDSSFQRVAELYGACKFRAALQETLALAKRFF